MELFRELVTSDVGLASLFVILLVIAIAIYLWRWVTRQMRDSERLGS